MQNIENGYVEIQPIKFLNGLLRLNFFEENDREIPCAVVELRTERPYMELVHASSGYHSIELTTSSYYSPRGTTVTFYFETQIQQHTMINALYSSLQELEKYRESDDRDEEQEYVAQYGYELYEEFSSCKNLEEMRDSNEE